MVENLYRSGCICCHNEFDPIVIVDFTDGKRIAGTEIDIE